MRIGLKMLMVAVLTLAILLPLAMIRGTITERQEYRRQAVADIARSYAGAQTFAGPVLVVPYSERVEVEERDAQGFSRKAWRRQAKQWVFFPRTLDVRGRLQPGTRKRGLHEVRVYELRDAIASADFDVQLPVADAGRERSIGAPWLSVSFADVRGLLGTPHLAVDGVEHPIAQGAHNGPGIHALLATPAEGGRLRLRTRLDFTLAGTESLALVPLGDRNTMAIDSSWPHPRFDGSFLPRTRRVDAKGFSAQWEISALATRAQAQFLAGLRRPATDDPAATAPAGNDAAGEGIDSVGVSLVEPVNVYTQADRASKYGVLFVVLTFVGFFMYELLRQLPIHPIQYGLVGLALAIFFLLLVSLSEHIEFGWAYLVSSAACIGLLWFYLSAVLRSAARGTGFAAMLALLYAALYGLLVSEDNALVLGAGLLFAILAAIMGVTRKVDWYAVAERRAGLGAR
jgi:inner membrane protein